MIFGDPDVSEKNTVNLNREFETANRINPDKSVYSTLSLADQVLMIFTSGTTGLPKGNMTHNNVYFEYYVTKNKTQERDKLLAKINYYIISVPLLNMTSAAPLSVVLSLLSQRK